MTLENFRVRPLRTQSVSSSREALCATAAGSLLMVVFCAYYLNHSWINNEANPRLLSEFQAHRPYQLRILMPFLLHLSTHYLSLDLARSCQVLTLGFSLGLFFVFRVYLAEFCAPRAAQWLALGLVPPLFAFYSYRWFYLHDIPATFFATLGLLFAAQKRWRWYLVTFAIATLNAENSFFIALAFGLTMAKTLPRRQFVALLASQAGIWLLIRLFLSLRFAANPSVPLELQLAGNITTLWSYLSHWQAPPGFTLTVLVLVVLWFVARRTRAIQPPFLRRARGVVIPFLVLMSVVGVLNETRLYGELIPVLLAPALIGFFNWSGARLHTVNFSPNNLVP